MVGIADSVVQLLGLVPNPVRVGVRNAARHSLEFFHRQASSSLSDEELRASALVVAPHPDDETLGCGGTVALKRRHGAQVTVVFMTDGSGSHSALLDRETLRLQRQQEGRAACQALGVDSGDVFFFDYCDGALSASEEAAQSRLAALIEERRPAQLFVPFQIGEHVDHSASGRIGLRAASAGDGHSVVVFEYPIWFMRHWPWVSLGDTEATGLFRTSAQARFGAQFLSSFRVRVDVATVIENKRRALAAHVSQVERRQGDPRWHTLADVCDGEFLEFFLSGSESFRRVVG